MYKNPELGLLTRVFAVRDDLAEIEAQKALLAVRHMLTLNESIPGKPIKRITLIVPTDRRYEDSDSGRTLDLLQQMTAPYKKQGVVVSESPTGDLSCVAMNRGCRETYFEAGLPYTFTLSATVVSWLNRPVMNKMLEALRRGALIVPLAIEPHRRFVVNGRPLGTCTIWDNQWLFDVGGFNLMAARPMRKGLRDTDGTTRVIEDYWPHKRQDVSYVIGGMEEAYPTIEMIRVSKPRRIIAPIDPTGLVQGDWVMPTDPERRLREETKRATKFSRWLLLSSLMGVGPSYCLGGIMEGYEPKPEDIDTLAEY